ncbi:hypothetical protein E2C01_009118 [Portunus trituberculatus]|uniref:Uncharacterized protein n=1 Tax=Portunus trituberculatus TaxID=210409 RepID=A0A5B7D5A9_PORTR|nr:hypothetical protein [Portunus trituberculatus]
MSQKITFSHDTDTSYAYYSISSSSTTFKSCMDWYGTAKRIPIVTGNSHEALVHLLQRLLVQHHDLQLDWRTSKVK